MASAKTPAPAAKPAPVATTDDRLKQQVRLACVQAVTARAVASGAVYDVERTVEAADTLAEYVLTGLKPKKSIAG